MTRLITMSVSDLLDDWFESEEVKASLAINGVIGTWAGPESPGTAYVMAHHSIGDVGDGHLGSWGFPEGGMGAVADTMQLSEGEAEAHELLKRHLERTLDGSRVTVLNRDNSADRLEPAGRPGARAAAALPDRGELPDATTSELLLVGGEVIGSVLVNHPVATDIGPASGNR